MVIPILEVTVLDRLVKLERHAKGRGRDKGRYRVTYGLEVKSNLTYMEATQKFGLCVLHSATCKGLLD